MRFLIPILAVLCLGARSVPEPTPDEERNRYVMYSFIFTQEVFNCMMMAAICELDMKQDMQPTVRCDEMGNLCVLMSHKRWQKVVKENGWEKWEAERE